MMKYEEFVKVFDKDNGGFDKWDLNIKEYIPFIEKINIITQEYPLDEGGTSDLIGLVTEIQNNYKVKNPIKYEMISLYVVCKYYCDFEFDESMYDFLYVNDFKKWLYGKTHGDSQNFIHWFNVYLDKEIESYNSYANIQNSIMDPEVIAELTSKLKNVDPENLDIVNKASEKVKKDKE